MNIDIGDVREMLECGTATNMELTEAVEFLLRERRALGREIAGVLLIAAVWGAAIIWSVESRYRAQRKADRIKRKADEIAAASNVQRHLCGMDER